MHNCANRKRAFYSVRLPPIRPFLLLLMNLILAQLPIINLSNLWYHLNAVWMNWGCVYYVTYMRGAQVFRRGLGKYELFVPYCDVSWKYCIRLVRWLGRTKLLACFWQKRGQCCDESAVQNLLMGVGTRQEFWLPFDLIAVCTNFIHYFRLILRYNKWHQAQVEM